MQIKPFSHLGQKGHKFCDTNVAPFILKLSMSQHGL